MIIFSREDIAYWSIFSGDNNKLHDASPPAQCIVQGMRVFVYMLERIEHWHSTNHYAFKIEAFFRRPIYTDNAYYLTMPDMNKIMFGCTAQGNAVTATTHCNIERFTERNLSCKERISIDNEAQKKHRSHFYKVLSEPTTELSFYCALCFSTILASRTFLTYKNKIYKNPNKYFDDYIITHLSQTVEWSPADFQKIVNTEQKTLNASVIENNDNFISSNTVTRSLVYTLCIDDNEILRMKSRFLVEENKINKE